MKYFSLVILAVVRFCASTYYKAKFVVFRERFFFEKRKDRVLGLYEIQAILRQESKKEKVLQGTLHRQVSVLSSKNSQERNRKSA